MSYFIIKIPVDTGRTLNVHKTFRRRPVRLLNVLCTFNIRPVSTGISSMKNELLTLSLKCHILSLNYLQWKIF